MEVDVMGLLKIALGVVGALLSLLIGIIAYFLRAFDSKVLGMANAISEMSREYASMKTTLDAIKERVNGVAEKHGEKIGSLERQVAGLEHDVANLKDKLDRTLGPVQKAAP